MISVVTSIIPLIVALCGGSGVTAELQALFVEALRRLFASPAMITAFGTVTPTQWLTLVANIAEQSPEVQKALADLHAVFGQIVTDVAQKKLPHFEAASNARAWIAANQPKQIPGYGADGSLGSIPNPDA